MKVRKLLKNHEEKETQTNKEKGNKKVEKLIKYLLF